MTIKKLKNAKVLIDGQEIGYVSNISIDSFLVTTCQYPGCSAAPVNCWGYCDQHFILVGAPSQAVPEKCPRCGGFALLQTAGLALGQLASQSPTLAGHKFEGPVPEETGLCSICGPWTQHEGTVVFLLDMLEATLKCEGMSAVPDAAKVQVPAGEKVGSFSNSAWAELVGAIDDNACPENELPSAKLETQLTEALEAATAVAEAEVEVADIKAALLTKKLKHCLAGKALHVTSACKANNVHAEEMLKVLKDLAAMGPDDNPADWVVPEAHLKPRMLIWLKVGVYSGNLTPQMALKIAHIYIAAVPYPLDQVEAALAALKKYPIKMKKAVFLWAKKAKGELNNPTVTQAAELAASEKLADVPAHEPIGDYVEVPDPKYEPIGHEDDTNYEDVNSPAEASIKQVSSVEDSPAKEPTDPNLTVEAYVKVFHAASSKWFSVKITTLEQLRAWRKKLLAAIGASAYRTWSEAAAEGIKQDLAADKVAQQAVVEEGAIPINTKAFEASLKIADQVFNKIAANIGVPEKYIHASTNDEGFLDIKTSPDGGMPAHFLKTGGLPCVLCGKLGSTAVVTKGKKLLPPDGSALTFIQAEPYHADCVPVGSFVLVSKATLQLFDQLLEKIQTPGTNIETLQQQAAALFDEALTAVGINMKSQTVGHWELSPLGKIVKTAMECSVPGVHVVQAKSPTCQQKQAVQEPLAKPKPELTPGLSVCDLCGETALGLILISVPPQGKGIKEWKAAKAHASCAPLGSVCKPDLILRQILVNKASLVGLHDASYLNLLNAVRVECHLAYSDGDAVKHCGLWSYDVIGGEFRKELSKSWTQSETPSLSELASLKAAMVVLPPAPTMYEKGLAKAPVYGMTYGQSAAEINILKAHMAEAIKPALPALPAPFTLKEVVDAVNESNHSILLDPATTKISSMAQIFVEGMPVIKPETKAQIVEFLKKLGVADHDAVLATGVEKLPEASNIVEALDVVAPVDPTVIIKKTLEPTKTEKILEQLGLVDEEHHLKTLIPAPPEPALELKPSWWCTAGKHYTSWTGCHASSCVPVWICNVCGRRYACSSNIGLSCCDEPGCPGTLVRAVHNLLTGLPMSPPKGKD